MSSSQPLDFAALLSRDYRPSRLAQITPKEKGNLRETPAHHHHHHHHHHPAEEIRLCHQKSPEYDEEDQGEADLDVISTTGYVALQSKLLQDEQANRLVLQLVAKTPAYKKYIQQDDEDEIDTAAKLLWTDRGDSDLKTYIPIPPATSLVEVKEYLEDEVEGVVDDCGRALDGKTTMEKYLPPAFHQVELGDWESKIEWEGYKPNRDKSDKGTAAISGSAHSVSPNDPTTLLQKPRNPFLDNIDFEKLISWSGSLEDVRRKAGSVPLILELGVAGQSIAKHVLPSHRPPPYANSDEYQSRMEASLGGEIKSTAELSKGTLHANKEDLERLIEQRQKKRRQMAKDKTSRVTEAMGTLGVLGGGRGRTITSSLMGPGGTERTGRPSRHVGAGLHETEYIEQLDMITNHLLYKDLSTTLLREYNRPKLPYSVVRTSLIWHFYIRYIATGKKNTGTTSNAVSGESSSSWVQMMGAHAGAVSKAKLRTEADLTPTEGNLVLFEYSEERPPIQLTKGMASKIVTYYRGDKSRCPVSAGGGDRPTRRKRQGTEAQSDTKAAPSENKENKVEKPPRLLGPNTKTKITDWVGKLPKKSKEDRNSEKESIHILPEGVTEILHPKTHGPFIGEIDDGQSVTGLISNLFVAPIFKQEPESTDFLMILGKSGGKSIPGRHESMNVVLRELPSSTYTVGQIEPRTRVYANGTQGEKNFTGPFYSYQLAKYLSQADHGGGCHFEDIHRNVLPNLHFSSTVLRQRLKHVAIYDKPSGIWTCKRIGEDDYPGVDALGKSIAPEGIVAHDTERSASLRMNDLGIYQLHTGPHGVATVGVTMVYLAGQVNAARELARKVKKLGEMSKTNKSLKALQVRFYDEASQQLETISKSLRQQYEVAKFIYEELQLCPWNITGEFIDVHKKGEGTGMMKLTGLGDPSGIGAGFSFLREADAKPSKNVAASAMSQTAQMKKITGTEDDLRKLTMKQMGRILKSYGMSQKHIDTLKRWDRVHVIRDLSTKAASDGIGDGLERFARGEKMKLSEQKQMYRERINVIWKREIASLSSDSAEGRSNADGGEQVQADVEDGAARASQKKDDAAKEESDSESDDDDFAADLEEEMMDRTEANQLVAGQSGGDASLGKLRTATQDTDLSKDARDLAALKRQREEERVAQEGLSTLAPAATNATERSNFKKKIVRKRITKTYPDGRTITTFKFIIHPQEVGQIMARLTKEAQEGKESQRRYIRPEYQADEKHIGHSMFEDEDDFEFTNRGGKSPWTKRRGAGRRGGARSKSRQKDLQIGKLKNRVSNEDRMKKRKREEDEMEVYQSMQRKQGTSNRKERGSIRDRRPHVIFANRLEEMRNAVESRPTAGPFLKPVPRKTLPKYYEIISHPMDLSTIRSKIQNHKYATAEQMLKDFQLMKENAIKFNGVDSRLGVEAIAICDAVSKLIDETRAELLHLEEAVAAQMSTKQPEKRRKKIEKKTGKKGAAGGSTVGTLESSILEGLTTDINLDDLEFSDDSDD